MHRLALSSLVLLLLHPAGASALEILAPAADATFKPGGTVHVVVSASATETFARIGIFAAGREFEATPVPGEARTFQADVTTPTDIVGPAYIVALGEEAESFPVMVYRRITIDPGAILRLVVSAPSSLSGLGREAKFSVLAQFEDGIFRDVTSPQTGTTYSAGAGDVVKVYPEGVLLSAGVGTATLIAQNRGVSATARISVSVPAGDDNHVPVANPGPDQTVVAETIGTISGRASTDQDGDALEYRWRQSGGRGVMLTVPSSPEDGDIAEARFVAPSVTAPQVLEFTLAVRDAKGALSVPKAVRVTVVPKT